MSLIQFRLTLSFSTSSMADLRSFSTKEFYWLASCFWGIIICKLGIFNFSCFNCSMGFSLPPTILRSF
ncbi:hypothetical protein E1A91_A03G000400v1 [Gossypium mustelinum]|uniref:Uncharacterized protein n=1 Tax=Gossypium mustelinum TaxID=34275 RepID=A0A5D2ZTT9_GOSMU|nr:hypothetical protein E1A91_A03G000400v1 [Gossypium mustelinum]